MQILWIATSGSATVAVYECGCTTVNKRPVDFSRQEREYLKLLAQAGGTVQTPQMILSRIYGTGNQHNPKIVDVVVSKIRRSLNLQHPGAGKVIRTARGRGHAFGMPTCSSVPLKFLPTSKKVLAKILADSGKYPTELPSPEDCNSSWGPARKALALLLVANNVFTAEQIIAYYPDLSTEEFEEWRIAYSAYGLQGLCLAGTKA